MGAPDLCDLLGGPLADNGAASGPGLRTEIDYPIGPLDDVHMVLDDDDGVSGIYQTVENVDENPYVVEVEASCGLVQDIELATLPFSCLGQLPGNLEPLRLSAGESRGRLTQPEIAEPNLLQLPERGTQAWLVPEPSDRFVDCPLQHIMDRASLDSYVQHLGPIPGATAGLAGHIDVGQEDHLDLNVSGAFTGLAPPAGQVEREGRRTVLALAGQRLGREQLANLIEGPDVRHRI